MLWVVLVVVLVCIQWLVPHLQTEYQEPAMSVRITASEKSPWQWRQVENPQALSSDDALHSHLDPVLVPRACQLKAVRHSWMTASAVPTVSSRRPRQLKIYGTQPLKLIMHYMITKLNFRKDFFK